MEGFKQLFKSVKTLNARGRILEDLKINFFENYFLHKLPLKSITLSSLRGTSKFYFLCCVPTNEIPYFRTRVETGVYKFKCDLGE